LVELEIAHTANVPGLVSQPHRGSVCAMLRSALAQDHTMQSIVSADGWHVDTQRVSTRELHASTGVHESCLREWQPAFQ
jgi:hypothetical protein